MKSEWSVVRAADFIHFNPRPPLKKGTRATKIGMDQLRPFTKGLPKTGKAPFSGGSRFSNGDTIMARITPCLENGKTAFVDILEPDEVAFGSTEFTVLRARDGISDAQFIYYLATSPAFRSVAIKSMAGTSGRQRVQQSVLNEMELTVPPLEEQRFIGALLATLDAKIELNQRINGNLQRQAQAVFDVMFPSNAGPGWKPGRLSDLVTVRYGKGHKQLADGIYPVFGSGGVMRHAERPLYDQESVLIPRKGTLNNVMYVNEPFWAVDTMFYTEMRVPNAAKYVYHTVKAKDLAAMNAGSAVPSMTAEILNRIEIAIPSAGALEQFEKTVSPMYSAMGRNGRESFVLAGLRDALLPKLMSGELDLSAVQL